MKHAYALTLFLISLQHQGVLTGANSSSPELGVSEISTTNQTSQATSDAEICKVDEDCEKHPKEICSEDFECVHKNLFPLLPLEYVGIVVIAILMALSCMGGIGGGGVVVPLCMIFFSFDTKKAVALSGFSILICSVTRYTYNLRQKHPEKDAVCLDYGLASVMLPTVLIGSLIGVLVNDTFPDLVLQIILSLLLMFLSVQAGLKARTIFQKETRDLKHKRQIVKQESTLQDVANIDQQKDNNNKDIDMFGFSSAQQIKEQEQESPDDPPIEVHQKEEEKDQEEEIEPERKISSQILPAKCNQIMDEPNSESGETLPEKSLSLDNLSKEEQQELVNLLKKEKSHWRQWNKHLLCLTVLLTLILVTLFRGSKRTESIVGLKKCSPGDWLILIGFCLVCLLVTFFSVKIIKAEQILKVKAGYQLGNDLEFTQGNCIKVVGIGLCGGIASGAFGLGGGAIFNPVLLYLGLPPKVVSATSMYMIMYSTAASSFVYIIFGTLDIFYGLWISMFSVIGTIIGLKILDNIMSKYNRQSPIVIILVFLLALAAVMVPIFGVMDVLDQKKHDGLNIWEFKSFC